MITVRPYRPTDAAALLELFRETVRRVNSRDYRPDQIAAWASEEIDPEQWSRRFEGRFVVVAEDERRPAGFTELEADGHIDRFYVSADHQGQGIGRALMDEIAQEGNRRGITRLYLEASITARPFFERQGFRLIAEQTVTLRRIEFTNYRMELVLR